MGNVMLNRKKKFFLTLRPGMRKHLFSLPLSSIVLEILNSTMRKAKEI